MDQSEIRAKIVEIIRVYAKDKDALASATDDTNILGRSGNDTCLMAQRYSITHSTKSGTALNQYASNRRTSTAGRESV